MAKLADRITSLLDDELSKSKIEATLILEDYSSKDISDALKEAGLIRARTSFNSDFLDFLASESRTEAEAKTFVLGYGSANAERKINRSLAIAKFALEVEARVRAEFAEAETK